MAERVGFEPTKELPLNTLSKRTHKKPLGLLVLIILTYFLRTQIFKLVTSS